LKSLKPDEASEVSIIDTFISNHASTYQLSDPYYENLILLLLQNRIFNAAW
jgi:hypothetical protein